MVLAALLLPALLRAQVEKRVEVTKAYVPHVGQATKLRLEPNMVDTVKMNPDIDYTITPLSIETNLATDPIRPAQVTYWEFNRPLPCCLKVGAGYPLNSALDFHIATQNASTGYALAYLNHAGSYSKITNDFGGRHNSTQMYNRAGAAAGKYLGRRVLEAEVNYTDRLMHAYGSPGRAAEASTPGLAASAPGLAAETFAPGRLLAPGAEVRAGVGEARIRLGDDFLDLDRFNFNIELFGSCFKEYSRSGYSQYDLGAAIALSKRFGRHLFRLDLGGERIAARRGDHYTDMVMRGGLRYGYRARRIDILAGADYLFDRVEVADRRTRHYVMPYARLRFDPGHGSFVPFVELDGEWQGYSFGELMLLNPYVAEGIGLTTNSVDYRLRVGVDGNILGKRVAYRAYFGMTLAPDRLYWRVVGDTDGNMAFEPTAGRQLTTSVNLEAEYRPVSRLHLSLGLHGYLYNDDDELSWAPEDPLLRGWSNGAPAFRADFGLRYRSRKLSFGITAEVQSVRTWSVYAPQPAADAVPGGTPGDVPGSTPGDVPAGAAAQAAAAGGVYADMPRGVHGGAYGGARGDVYGCTRGDALGDVRGGAYGGTRGCAPGNVRGGMYGGAPRGVYGATRVGTAADGAVTDGSATAGPSVIWPDRFKVPFTVDLRVDVDWHVSERVTLFAEGRNLTNAHLYEWAFYPSLGANFTAGAKIRF